MEKFLINLAYKHVAFAIMIAQVNEFAQKLDLPLKRPVTIADVLPESHVSPPRLMGFGGSILTTNYAFGFSRGYLANFKKREAQVVSDAGVRLRNEELARAINTMDADEAYRLATNSLQAIGIDVLGLELKHGHKVTQQLFYKNPALPAADLTNKNNVVLLPMFDISWGTWKLHSDSKSYAMPLLSVTVLGSSKEVVEMHITDDSVRGGAKQPVKDIEKLLAIRDEEFMSYNDLQKSNLVAQYSQATSADPGNAQPVLESPPKWVPARK